MRPIKVILYNQRTFRVPIPYIFLRKKTRSPEKVDSARKTRQNNSYTNLFDRFHDREGKAARSRRCETFNQSFKPEQKRKRKKRQPNQSGHGHALQKLLVDIFQESKLLVNPPGCRLITIRTRLSCSVEKLMDKSRGFIR